MPFLDPQAEVYFTWRSHAPCRSRYDMSVFRAFRSAAAPAIHVSSCEGLRTPAMTTPAPRADSRRRQSANGRNRERWASTVRRVLRGFDVGTDADEYRWIDARRG